MILQTITKMTLGVKIRSRSISTSLFRMAGVILPPARYGETIGDVAVVERTTS